MFRRLSSVDPGGVGTLLDNDFDTNATLITRQIPNAVLLTAPAKDGPFVDKPCTMAKMRIQMGALHQRTHLDYMQDEADLKHGLMGARNDKATAFPQPAMSRQFSHDAGSWTSVFFVLEIVKTDSVFDPTIIRCITTVARCLIFLILLTRVE